MKKVKFIIVALLMLLCATQVNAEATQEGPFYFDWENTILTDVRDIVVEVSDNFSFKNGTVIVRTTYDEENNTFSIELERRDLKGKIIKTNTIEDNAFFSAITDHENIYIVTISYASKEKSADSTSTQMIVKLDENLEVVKTLPFEENYIPGVDGMINARRFGHDILAIKDDYLYVFCGEEYMLKTKLELDKWETMEYKEEDFDTYFPDLSTEYKIMDNWMGQLSGNVELKNDYIDIDVTTHIYDDKMITSGMRYSLNVQPGDTGGEEEYEMPFTGVIKIFDKEENIVFEQTNKNYMKFFEARIMGDYVVAIGLSESTMMGNGNTSTLGNDIVVYDLEGNLLQTIETEGSYVFLNEIASGFVATHVESCEDIQAPVLPKGIPYVSGSNVGGNSTYTVCTYNTEAYYLPLNIETKVIGEGKGTIEAIKSGRKGEEITFKVTPEKGYVLGEVRVTDKTGNTIIFTNNTFTMPNADVTIEAIFVPENSDTADIEIITIVGLLVICGFVVLNSIKKLKALN